MASGQASNVGPARAGGEFSVDELLRELVVQGREVLAARERLRELLAANRLIITGDHSLPELLRRITEAACRLLGARYGALAVAGPTRNLEQFSIVGLSATEITEIGEFPHGRGVLGLLMDEPQSLRLADVTTHPCFYGFPAHHPPMQSFLGTPIRVRGELFGILYVTEKHGEQFSAEDEQLLTALADTAGIAIDNTRLLEQARRGQRWMHTAAGLTRHILTGASPGPLIAVAHAVEELAAADLVTIVVPTEPDRARVEVAVGQDAAPQIVGVEFAIEESLSGQVIASGQPLIVEDLSGESGVNPVIDPFGLGPALFVPLPGREAVLGALCAGRRRHQPRFTDADLETAVAFATHAALAIENAGRH